MPTINLRLTPEQHAELKAWAHDGHRSIQKEIIWRLFSAEGHMAPKIGPATDEPREAIEVPPDSTQAELHAERVESGADTRYSERDERMKTDLEWLKRRSGRK